MSHKSRFLVGLTSAVLTFGALFATMGHDNFNCGRPMCHPHHPHSCIGECNHHASPAHCDTQEGESNKAVADTVK